MGSLWRSEPMERIQLFIQHDAAKDTIDELGELGVIQFVDLNPNLNSFQRTFVTEIKRCEELERRLRFIFEVCKLDEKTSGDKMREITFDNFTTPGTEPGEMDLTFDDLEMKLETTEKELRQMNTNFELLVRNRNELKETMHVLSKESNFFTDSDIPESEEGDSAIVPLLQNEASSGRSLGFRFITGVVPQEKFNTFERVLWRSLRGNLFLKSAEIEEEIVDPATGELVKKLVFIVFYQGDQSALRIKRICDSFGARVYACSPSAKERMEALEQVTTRIEEMQNVIASSTDTRHHYLSEYLNNMEQYFAIVRKHKAIHTVLNMCDFDVGRKCLVAEGWCPTRYTDDILSALSFAQKRSGTQIPSVMSVIDSKETPPTNFNMTNFAAQFQMIVDAYGVPRYREVNPGVFTIITFPFLFAVMFGDVGHAIIICLAALAMIIFQKKILATKGINELFMMLFDGRYLIFVMAVFSIFTGLLYNDVFAIPLNIFGSKYSYNEEKNTYSKPDDSVYPFGIDPAWRTASNELYYVNSMKMKLSVILGIIQMMLGVLLSLFNHIHFRHYIDVFCEFIPQAVFMISFLGYLVFIILYKWMVPDLSNYPYLINVLIDMILNVGSVKDEDYLYPGQNGLQIALVILMLLSVLMMFIPKPIILNLKHKWKLQAKGRPILAPSLNVNTDSPETENLLEKEERTLAYDKEDENEDENNEDDDDDEEPFELGEIIIVNSIHSVEYILGCISNTASYLRLWALSLAHSQLSIVFYEQIMIRMMGTNFFFMFCAFGLWGGATIAVLCLMEALSAFLHALRLHWVEFQNKFFHGDGIPFIAYSNKDISAKASEELMLLEKADHL